MSCRCQINGGGLITGSGSATGSDPRVLTVTCEDVQDCVGQMFNGIGFVYDDDFDIIRAPPGTDPGFVLTAVGDGTAVWAAPP